MMLQRLRRAADGWRAARWKGRDRFDADPPDLPTAMTESSATPQHQGGYKLVLASGSPRRLALLRQVGIEPDALLPADIEEIPKTGESPRSLSIRLAEEKARMAARVLQTRADLGPSFLIAADTVVSVGRRILPKCELQDEAEQCLRLLSGRAHRVHTGLCVLSPKGGMARRIVETRVRFKRLTRAEMEAYLAAGEWRGKAGGYAIQGRAGGFVVKLVGSYTGVVGLPLYETLSMLAGQGYAVLAKKPVPSPDVAVPEKAAT